MNLLLKRWLFAVAILAVVIIAVAPQPQPKSAGTASATDGWLVPRLPTSQHNSPLALNSMLQSRLWGGQADAAQDGDDKAARWRVAGITGSAGERYAIVQFGDDRVSQLKAGERFPDGTLIAQVRDNGVCVLIEAKKRFLPLDGQVVPIVW